VAFDGLAADLFHYVEARLMGLQGRSAVKGCTKRNKRQSSNRYDTTDVAVCVWRRAGQGQWRHQDLM